MGWQKHVEGLIPRQGCPAFFPVSSVSFPLPGFDLRTFRIRGLQGRGRAQVARGCHRLRGEGRGTRTEHRCDAEPALGHTPFVATGASEDGSGPDCGDQLHVGPHTKAWGGAECPPPCLEPATSWEMSPEVMTKSSHLWQAGCVPSWSPR